ncbi:MAG: hypothetical protein K2J29_09505, partial [Muribaculaceae bacterium]|nr:hypothetical protein [Muribaculaceae bacterium]
LATVLPEALFSINSIYQWPPLTRTSLSSAITHAPWSEGFVRTELPIACASCVRVRAARPA